MTHFEELEQFAHEENVTVIPYDFSGTRISGLYCDGTIALSYDLKSSAERSCVLAEELGHHITSFGDIIDQSKTENRKQELRARLWAYNQRIGLSGIVKAFEAGCQNRHELAEHLDVTEEFLQDAIDCYRSKYGKCTVFDNYTVFFEPCLAVMKKLEP